LKLGSTLFALTIVVGGAACSGSQPSDAADAPEVDPGKPASEFGPKCGLELVDDATSTKISFEDCTASAASNERTSHLYLYFGRLPQSAQRMYVSLVLATTPIAPGLHPSARAGAIEATLSDGRTFSAGDVKTDGSLQLVIDKAGADMNMSNVFYVTGSLESTLVDVRNTSSKLRLRAKIN
jgi:hypothetical protein